MLGLTRDRIFQKNDSNHGSFYPQFGALPVTPRLPFGKTRFDCILVAIDVQVGHKGRLNNIFVTSHPIIDYVTFVLSMISAKISHVNEFIPCGDILGVINDAKFKKDIWNTISFRSSFSGFTLNLTKC